MMCEYLSNARSLQVKVFPKTLRLRICLKEKELIDVIEGLFKLVDYINELFPRYPPHFHFDASKIDFLRKAVTEYQSW